MTRKDYELIAAAIKAADAETFSETGSHSSAETALLAYSKNVADVLAADNPRFDRERFLQACGVQS